jgi:hydroxymethylbilane synthase
MSDIVKVGSRQSPLAVIQAEHAISKIDYPAEVITMLAEADLDLSRPVHEMGGKGMFCTKLEQALLSNRIDCAVHSAKDCATQETAGTDLLGVIYTGDSRDCVIGDYSLHDLPAGSRIGTSAPRRTEAIKIIRPDCTVLPIRGNINTRLNKWKAGEVDALVLGQSVIDRMKLNVPHHTVDQDVILPAAGAGKVVIQIRSNDSTAKATWYPAVDFSATQELWIERGVLRAIDGDCHTAVGLKASVDTHNDDLQLEAMSVQNDQLKFFKLQGALSDAPAMMEEMSIKILA